MNTRQRQGVRTVFPALSALPGIIVGCMVMTALSSCVTTPQQAAGKPRHHLADGTYRNPQGSPADTATFADMVAFFFRRMGDTPPRVPDDHVIAQSEALTAFNAAQGDDSITWLGHAAFLLRLDGKLVLTDPYLTDVASPVAFGPKRYVQPGLPLDRIPEVDIILVSHNHYEHLDAKTVEQLPGKDRVAVVVPLGLGEFFRSRGYANVTERDWYETVTVADIEIEVLPAIHFSRRGLLDRNRTLWGGFAIRSGKRTVFHSGDTGYGPVFSEIGERAGPFDVALIAIGAYEPASIMKPVHVTPEEALQIASDIRARTAIGMHWGTVQLTDEPAFEPRSRLIAAARNSAWRNGRASVMRIGETRLFDDQIARSNRAERE